MYEVVNFYLNKGKIFFRFDIFKIVRYLKNFKEVKRIFFFFIWGNKLRCRRFFDLFLIIDMIGKK